MSRRFDFIASAIFLIIGLFFIIASQRLGNNVIGGTVTPATFPQVAGIVLMVLSVLLFVDTIKTVKTTEKHLADIYYRRFFIIVLSMALYILLIEPLGFVISTFLFLLVAFQTMHRGKLLSSILIAGGFSLVVHFVFIKLLEASVQSWPSFIN
ncbi:MAG: hypothetical protein H6R05_1500 [Burkholderiaceae bacterium]|nr:hypothetical protein [Burkholderiaceae bacterium]